MTLAVLMAMTNEIFKLDERRMIATLTRATQELDGSEDESVLDFSLVCRIDSGGLRALEEFARVAEEKSVKVVVRGAHIDVYKALKLAKLAPRVRFEN